MSPPPPSSPVKCQHILNRTFEVRQVILDVKEGLEKESDSDGTIEIEQ